MNIKKYYNLFDMLLFYIMFDCNFIIEETYKFNIIQLSTIVFLWFVIMTYNVDLYTSY